MTIRVLKPRKAVAREGLQTSLHWTHDRTVSGFVFDPADPSRTFVVELLVDGCPIKSVHARDHVEALTGTKNGDGGYGFTFTLPEAALADGGIVEARVANLNVAIGKPVTFGAAAPPALGASSAGAVRWLGGLRFAGSIADADATAIDIRVDGEQVLRARPSGWCHVGEVSDARAARAFDLHLPERFADGAVHRLVATNARGERLEGCPLPFIAFNDGLERTVAATGSPEPDILRSAIFDRLVPMSFPFTEYRRWLDLAPKAEPAANPLKAAVIAVGPGDIDETLASLNEQCASDWVAASLPETADYGGFRNEAALEFLDGDGADADFVVFVPAGTLLAPSALTRIAATFAADQNALAVYGDLEVAGDDGKTWPLALPAFDYERMLEQGYCSHVFALRRAVAIGVLEQGASNLFRVFNALVDDASTAVDTIVQLPGAVATLPTMDLAAASEALAVATQQHLRMRGVAARVAVGDGQLLPAVQVIRSVDQRSVTVVIPTRNRKELLQACIDSIRPVLRRRACELIIVDNDSSDPDTLAYLSSLESQYVQILHVAGEFNFARLNNMAASVARGELLCLLNNDIQARDDGWLDEMLSRIVSDDVGAVGAQLLWPSGVVQHGGVVLGPNFAAAHAFNDRVDGDNGYADLLRVAHQCSAVTAACLLTRRDEFVAIGGMDEFRFPVNFNDVDYCLKLRAAGKRIVFTPHAKLLHLESASRGADKSPDRKARFERELQNLRAKWADALAADPFYSPMLSLDPIPFSALAWPLRAMAPRTSTLPIPVAVPPGL